MNDKNSNTQIFLSHIIRNRPSLVIYKPHYVLESFINLIRDSKTVQETMKWYKSADMFLLDSGAYTFMNRKNNKIEFSEYINKYINFINKYDIEYFFEMDIDNVVGYDKVLEYRKIIEDGTNKKCIPVWHKSRGLDEFYKMCIDYEYVAIGGIASREIKIEKDIELIKELCDIAHMFGCKIHGLGMLKLDLINHECPFDSVDGSSWDGHSGGYMYRLKKENNNTIIYKQNDNKKNHWRDILQNNFKIWTEFSIEKG